jgi:hypothetical protein
MSNENIKKFVDSLEKGDNLQAADAFKSSIADKVSSALDDRKTDVASNMFAAATVTTDTNSGSVADVDTTATETPAPEVASDETAQ